MHRLCDHHRAWPSAAVDPEKGLALLMGVISLLLTTPVSGADSRPNIVIILSDDMGYADIGVQGCRDIPTPHIDRLAAEGVRFTDAYTNGSFCTPTRAALLGGRYQQRYGVEDLTRPLPLAQDATPAEAAPLQLTAQQDHRLMMEAFKIENLRPGADGTNRDAPNAANYDESNANPYPDLPAP